MNERLPMLTVSRLAALLKEVVEENFAQVLVEGEVSNFSVPASGHFYFSLKDESAQLRAVMFRTQARLLPFRPENGMRVILSGRVSLYSQRGEVQLIAETLEPRGVGSLQVAFEQLKSKLAGEGLFAEARKRPLPMFPRTVGVVTSATGAAIHDIVNVLRRRGAGLRVVLRPVRVQGEGAAAEIAEAIADHNRLAAADVLIVGRGGGSLEDLWAFNEEAVARAIHASAIPVISAVGHEVDTTIADFVADLRAPTPSAAAELVARSRLELEGHLDHLSQRLAGQMQGRLALLDERVQGLTRRLRSPRQQLLLWQQRHADLVRRLDRSMARRQQETEVRLGTLAGRLDLLSPLRTLERGYAIALAEKTGKAVLDAGTLARGDRLQLRFARGRARATVEESGE
ncbi:MAG TPA: exodeoxyribonuclease VII large subunit [Desulfuromonadales bacterium]